MLWKCVLGTIRLRLGSSYYGEQRPEEWLNCPPAPGFTHDFSLRNYPTALGFTYTGPHPLRIIKRTNRPRLGSPASLRKQIRRFKNYPSAPGFTRARPEASR